jgi:2-octaprenylphenol hydroxylase
MSEVESVDIVVAGGGLVGAAAALGLQHQGWRVRLVERAAPVTATSEEYDSRVYAISPATQRFLRALGVWDAVAAQRVSAYQRMQVWEREPESALVFDANDLRAPELGHIVENQVLQAALWQALSAESLRVGSGVRTLRRDDDGVTLELDDGCALRTRLLVVAEGRDSSLRAQLGIELTAGQYPQTAVVCHVRTERPHRQTCWQRFLPTGPLALLPLADGRSSIVWSSTEASALLELDDASFCLALSHASQQALGAVLETTPRLRFPLNLQHADAYTTERAVLIGDAAHVVHPLAGQGVNLGLADAEALVATLGECRAQRRDPGQLRMLKRYERARRADVLDMIAVTDALYRAYALDLPGWDVLRGMGLRAVQALPSLRRQLVRRAAGLPG